MPGVPQVHEGQARNGWAADRLSSHSTQLEGALSLDRRDVAEAQTALQALADFTLGVTDRYAQRISPMVSGS